MQLSPATLREIEQAIDATGAGDERSAVVPLSARSECGLLLSTFDSRTYTKSSESTTVRAAALDGAMPSTLA